MFFMKLDRSLAHFINMPYNYIIESSGGTLSAKEGKFRNAKVIEDKDFAELEEMAKTNAFANDVFRRIKDIREFQSLAKENPLINSISNIVENSEQLRQVELKNNSFASRLLSSFSNAINQRLFLEMEPPKEFIDSLREWCEEKQNTEEYEARIRAADAIKKCYEDRSLNLNLVGYGLTSLPTAIKYLYRLEFLDISNNRLDRLPNEIGQLERLHNLGLSDNFFREFPVEILSLSNLTLLFLGGNQIQEIPVLIDRLTLLQIFNINNNRLAVLPNEICNLSEIRNLYLSDNPLRELPINLGNLRKLRHLYLRRTEITTLPDSLATLHSAGSFNDRIEIDVENSRMTINEVYRFEDRVDTLQRQEGRDYFTGPRLLFSINENQGILPLNNRNTLEGLLTEWLNLLQTSFQKETHKDFWVKQNLTRFPNNGNKDYLSFYAPLLGHEKKDRLKEFLEKLKNTDDFKKNETKNHVILKLNQYLEYACTNPEFLPVFMKLVEWACTTCSDRTAYYFNEIEAEWLLCTQAKEIKNDRDLAQLLIGLERKKMVDGYAHTHFEKKRLGDQIETVLAFQVGLREALRLPTTTEGMLYMGMSGVKEHDIFQAKEEVLSKTCSRGDIADILFAYSVWKDYIVKNNSDLFKNLTTKIYEELENLDISSEQAYRENADKLKEKHMQEEQKLIKTLTLQWVKFSLQAHGAF